MNLECQVCTGNKIGTSFHSLDDLQAHLFSNHHDGPLDVFQFVCHKCEFKFGTEYRLLRHEEKCGRESRSEEDTEKIRYKLQMYELLEVTLKYNMTKHQISGARRANPSNIETLKTRESPQTQKIKSEIPEYLENSVSNSRPENSERNGSGETTGTSPSVISNESTENLGNLMTVKAEVQDQNCFKNSAISTQSNVKTEPKDVDTSEVEVLGSVEIRKRKAPSKSAEHISHRSGVRTQQNVNSAGESSNLRHAKQAKTSLVSQEPVPNPSETYQDTSNAQSRTIDGTPLWKQFLLGSENVDEKQIPRFNSARDQEETMTLTSNLTNRIDVIGPWLHPEQVDPKPFQREEFRTYFGQFGKICTIGVRKNDKSVVTFKNCDSVAKCIQQKTHKIRGQDFTIWETTPSEYMWKKLVTTGNLSSENHNYIHLPPDLTNIISVTGPLLHPEEMDPKAFQKEMSLKYFGQFGKVIVVSYSLPKLEAKIGFDNCDSAARCIQQRNHTICGRDFLVRAEAPTHGMKDKIRANLRQFQGIATNPLLGRLRQARDTNRALGL